MNLVTPRPKVGAKHELKNGPENNDTPEATLLKPKFAWAGERTQDLLVNFPIFTTNLQLLPNLSQT